MTGAQTTAEERAVRTAGRSQADLADGHAFRGNIEWLVRLRWVATFGQCLTVALVRWVWQVSLSYFWPLLAIIAFTAGSNLMVSAFLQRRPSWATARNGLLLTAALITVDLVSLTGLLYLAGGPTNPFSLFYLVNLALAAVLLPGRWALGLTVLSITGYSSFFLFGYVPVAELEEAWHADSHLWTDVRKQGLLVAFAASALVITYFISRVATALAQREEALRRAEQRRAHSERLEALATLAAGAGHELASPLSTIAVIAKDLARHLEGVSVPPGVLEDVALIRSELEHCRSILNRMSAQAGQVVGERVDAFTLRRIVDETISGLRRSERVMVYGLETAGDLLLRVPLQALALALRNLLQNGLDASQPGQPVEFHVAADQHTVRFRVVDHGCGMPPEILKRAGEPFFTTKEPGQGMGLGLFLARNVIERLGGHIAVRSRPEQGTTVEVLLPRGSFE
ncbi:MAG: ATPase [Pirellulaceae bacterium]|nr:MAG: ATPase [Pirellulaceae bacterium]